MEPADTTQGPRKARPILTERDCLAVRRILNERVRMLGPFLEEGRFEALIRALGRYEQLSAQAGVSALADVSRPSTRFRRRWSDAPT